MRTLIHIDLNLFSMLLLAFVFLNGYTRVGWQSLRYRLFMLLVLSTAACQACDTLTWVFNGSSTALGYDMAVAANVLLFALGPLPAVVWVLYVYAVVTDSNRVPPWLLWLLIAPAVVCAAFSVASPFTHTFFYFTSSHLYHRGAAYAAGPFGALVLTLGGAMLAWSRRRDIGQTSLHTLGLFPLAPLVGGVLQMAVYGLTTTWSLTAFAILLTYVNMQDSRLDFDYLTGAYTRGYLDRYLRDRIASALDKPNASGFAVAFADLDDFKSINDTFGHSEGDAALCAASAIFTEAMEGSSMVARYAGDEFVLVLELGSGESPASAIARLEEAFATHNLGSGKPYPLSATIGYCPFVRHEATTAERMVRHADADMLSRKREMRAVHAV